MQKAAFSLKSYSFPTVMIDYTKKSKSNDIGINILPKGEYKKDTAQYKLIFDFSAENEKNNPFIKITCQALFDFKSIDKLDDIPDFFYKNSIAIVFPYIRAFVSTVTLQSNYEPLVLPTLNLSSLEALLREHTSEV